MPGRKNHIAHGPGVVGKPEGEHGEGEDAVVVFGIEEETDVGWAAEAAEDETPGADGLGAGDLPGDVPGFFDVEIGGGHPMGVFRQGAEAGHAALPADGFDEVALMPGFEGFKATISLMNDISKALPSGKLELNAGDIKAGEVWKKRLNDRPEIVALRHIHDALLAK
jgi:hypothetical protein